ncbi:MAG: RNA polymerase sigma factor [Gammaproteobacteria bacterium]|nr:MAG: RNA polymerase sigma factor [Gammaproteobacteria bacterium]
MQEKQTERTEKTFYDSLSDEELVKLIKDSGDALTLRKCQEQIYDRYARKVYFKCLGIVKDHDDAQDLTHDIMVKILLKIRTFRGDSPLFGWIYAVTYNHCLSWLQKRNKVRMQDFDEKSNEIADSDAELDLKKLTELRLEKLQILMDSLSESDRMILMMKYQDGFSVKDISTMLDLGESAVKMRLKRSRDRLAELVNNHHSDE